METKRATSRETEKEADRVIGRQKGDRDAGREADTDVGREKVDQIRTRRGRDRATEKGRQSH